MNKQKYKLLTHQHTYQIFIKFWRHCVFFLFWMTRITTTGFSRSESVKMSFWAATNISKSQRRTQTSYSYKCIIYIQTIIFWILQRGVNSSTFCRVQNSSLILLLEKMTSISGFCFLYTHLHSQSLTVYTWFLGPAFQYSLEK